MLSFVLTITSYRQFCTVYRLWISTNVNYCMSLVVDRDYAFLMAMFPTVP